jgi:hypothetical protein
MRTPKERKMQKIREKAGSMIVVTSFCLFLVSLARAGELAKSLQWVDHKPNPRFAVHDAGTPGDAGDDLVLDKKTGLIWARNANVPGESMVWDDALNYCAEKVSLGNLKGWHLPTKEEITSLVDPSQKYPVLPKGHPFVNVKYTYWTSTVYKDYPDDAWYISIHHGVIDAWPKIRKYYVWPVTGQ